MQRVEYAKRKAWVHMLSPAEIQSKIMSIPNVEYRAIIALTFLTMSRISEICVLKAKDVIRRNFYGKPGYAVIIGVEKRWGFAKVSPVFEERLFPELFKILRPWLSRNLQPNDWLFSDPGVYTYSREYKKKDGSVVLLTEVDNKKRKAVSKYVRTCIGINPHLFRHARYSICSYVYGFTENLLQSAGAWTRTESMKDYKRYAVPEEIAHAIISASLARNYD